MRSHRTIHHVSRAERAVTLQALEERRLLANVFWDGGGGSLSWNNPQNWSNNNVPTAVDVVTIGAQPGSGPIRIDGEPARVLRLTTSHDLTVAAGTSLVVDDFLDATAGADLSIAGELVWREGRMRAGGATTVEEGGRFVHTGAGTKWIERPLDNLGTIEWGGGDLRLFGTQAALVNHEGATLHITASGRDVYAGDGNQPIVNVGTIRVLLEPTARIDVLAEVDNEGEIDVQQGQFVLGAGGASSGVFNVEFGAELRFHQDSGRGYSFRDGTTFSGDGSSVLWHTGHRVSGTVDWGTAGVVIESQAIALTTEGPTVMEGTLINSGGTLVIDHSLRINGSLVMGDGALTGTASVWVHGNLDWYRGLVEGSGVLRIQPGAELNLIDPGLKQIGQSRQVWNRGTVNWNDGTIRLINTDSVFQNLAGGRFNADASGQSIYGAGAFLNKGFFEVAPGSQASIAVESVFSNLTQPGFGGVKVVSGFLHLVGDVPQFSAGGVLTYGLWSVNDGAGIISPASVNLTWSNAFVTLQGNGIFTAIDGLARNHGLLTLDRATPFFEPAAGMPFINSGSLVKRGSGITTIAVPFRNLGKVRIEGPTAPGASIGEIVIDNAVVATFVNEGDISIGVRARLQILGNFRQTSSGTIATTLRGTAAHEMGRVWVRGTTTLGGGLSAACDAGASPASGENYQFFYAQGGRAGQFDLVSLPTMGGGLTARLVGTTTGLSITVGPA